MIRLGRLWPRGLAALTLALVLATGGAGHGQTAPETPATPIVPATPADPATPGATPAPKSGGFGLTKTQTAGTVAAAGTSKGGKSISVLPSDANAPDYAAWDRLATRAETALADRGTSNNGLELLRGQLSDWRSAFSGAQSANSARIATLRTQIDALGPAPAEGATEAEEIVARRKTLTDQLVRLQAPGIAAEEAHSRAEGLIREIDRILRERQTEELTKLWPSPLNPANWPDAGAALRDTTLRLWTEGRQSWSRADRREEFIGNLPLVLLMLALAVLLIWRGRAWIESFALRVQGRASARGQKVWALLASLGQIVVPTLGVFLISVALESTGLPGSLGNALLVALPGAGLTLFVFWWLGGMIFPPGDTSEAPLALSAERRAEGRLLVPLLGLMLGAEALRQSLFIATQTSEAATAVLSLPFIALTGLFLWRFGQLLRRHVVHASDPVEALSYRNRLIGILGRGATLVGVVGPLLAAVGYVSAASALVYPAVATLALLGLLVILLQLVDDVHALIVRTEEDSPQQSLVPVLVGFALVLAALPVLALIWGARLDDLTEIWARFRAGVQLGETRISPSNFLYFAVIFGVGFTLTRLFQGALKSTILPKTTLDQGGQNAVVSGTGYLGIFLAGLIAINAAGIDLSGLAIVAGALSVGIGFGLQNIVSNFVSGIILLIERPVSEGDWIEVGTVSGTVKAISVRSTRIQTFDRSDVIVPNADLVTQRVTNWTRFNLSGRLIVQVGVDYDSDTRKVSRVLQEIAEAQPLAILNPPPTVAFMGLGADSLNFEIRMIIRDVNFSLSVRNEVNHEIVRRFREEGIAMPFNQRDIWFKNPQDLADALAHVRQSAAGSDAVSATAREAGTAARRIAGEPEVLPEAARREAADALDDETER